ncbi:hypothetical protein ACIQK6_09325 [Streptomyces sp. NPDC091682]|uniref:hypothetical protein n=1 Tax=Streptomyces sp. NPDC091682 TaxID=3366005 RepID=UPI00381B17EF
MNANGSNGSGRGGPRESPIPCSRPFLPLGDLNGHRPAGRPVDSVDSQERAALTRAFTRGNAGLAAAQSSLGDLGTALSETFHAAREAIDVVERFTYHRSAGQARDDVKKVQDRHAADGPESRRRGRQPWVWLQWVMLVLSVLFELPFVGEAVVLLLDLQDPDGFWTTVIHGFGYLAAIGVSCLQFALASVLARSLFRLRVRRGRRTERTLRSPRTAWHHLWRLDGPQRETRQPDELPWPGLVLPVVANALLIGLLAATAHSRAQQSQKVTATFGENGYLMAVFVLIALSLATLTTAVLAHNPYAESHKEAQGALSDAEEEARRVVPAARKLIAAHRASWHRLFAAMEQTADDAHGVVDEACAAIIDERADTGRAGTLELPLREYALPVDEEHSGTATPRLRLDVLERHRNLLAWYSPDRLEQELGAIVKELHDQFHIPGGPEPLARATASEG